MKNPETADPQVRATAERVDATAEQARATEHATPAGDGGHVVAPRTYLAVFAALMVLLVATVGAAEADLGFFNTPIALTIAVAKMILVLLYFMHLRYSSRLNWVIAAGGFFWLAVMIGGTMDDVISRGWLGFPGG